MEVIRASMAFSFASFKEDPSVKASFTSLKENAERSFSQISALNVVSEMISKQYSANPDGTGEIE